MNLTEEIEPNCFIQNIITSVIILESPPSEYSNVFYNCKNLPKYETGDFIKKKKEKRI